MSVTSEEIYQAASLARLKIEEAKIPEYTQNLNNLLTLANSMKAINTEGIEPMSHPLEGQKQRVRPDEITEKNQREWFQKNAPMVAEGLYLVPAVIE